MKKKLVLTAAVIAALSVASCNSKKAGQNGNDENASYTEDSALVEKDGSVKLPAVEGTYEGTLPSRLPRHQDGVDAQGRQHLSVYF